MNPSKAKSISSEVEVVAEEIEDSKIADLELEAGECHFHEAFTIHGSNPNRSQKRRCGYTMRYMPADVRCNDHISGRNHHIYLLRGEDRTNGFNAYTAVPEF